MKVIFRFEETEIREVDEQTEEVAADGSKTIKQFKVSKPVLRKFCLIRPNRATRESADLYQRAQYGIAVKAGMIPMALLAKRFENDDGVLSDAQKDELNKAWLDLGEKEREYQKAHLVEEGARSEEDKRAIQLLEIEIRELNERIRFLTRSADGLYQNTPEMWARNKAIGWYVLFLSYEDVNGKLIPFFGDGDLKARQEVYDKLDQSDNEFDLKIASRFLFATSVYFCGLASKQEEFEKIEKSDGTNNS